MESISNSGATFANVQSVQDTSVVKNNRSSDVFTQERQTQTTDSSDATELNNTTKVLFSEVDTDIREVEPALSEAVGELERFAQQSELKLAFSVDEKTDKSVITLKDKESGEVIRQIPSQELLDIAAQVRQITSENGSAVGLLVNGKF